MSDEKQDEKLDVGSGKASVVMRSLHHSVVLKWEISRKAKLSVFKSIFIPILTCLESWVMAERVRSKMHATEMYLLVKTKKVTMFTKFLRNTAIRVSQHRVATSLDQKILA